jgi:serine/threonine-protein kinase
MTAAERVLVVAMAGLVTPAMSYAQGASAEALFREGRRLLKQGELEAGCDKLEASEQLESSIGTLLNLGDCREKLGRPTSAWTAFRKAEALAKHAGNDAKREQEAKRRADRLESELASITVQVGPKAKEHDLVITRDGEVVAREQWGAAILVDPGSHRVVVEAKGFERWESEISVGKGGKRWVVVPSLEPIPEPTPEPPKPPVATTTPPKPEPPVAAPPPVEESPRVAISPPPPTPRAITVQPTWSTTRGIAVAVGALGVGAIAIGGYFASQAGDLQSQSNAICPTTTCDDPEGLRLNDEAQDQALRANVLFATGGLALLAGVVTWFVGKPDERTVITPVVTTSHVGASFARRF